MPKLTRRRSVHVLPEKLEERPLLASLADVSRSQILAEVDRRSGMTLIRDFVRNNPNSRVAQNLTKNIVLESSENIFRLKSGSLVQLKVKRTATLERAINAVKNVPGVRFASTDNIYKVQKDYVPNDPRWTTSQVLRPTYQLMDIDKAWDVTRGSSNVVVAVLDDGVDIEHEDLKDNIWRNPREIPGNGRDDDGNGYIDDINGWDFASNSNNINPRADPTFNNAIDSHGTIVSGLIAASIDNQIGMAGVAGGGTKIMPIR